MRPAPIIPPHLSTPHSRVRAAVGVMGGKHCWMCVMAGAGAIAPVCGPLAPSFGATGRPVAAGQEMIAVRAASGPHASLGDQAKVWRRFIGTWDCDFSFYEEDGSVQHAPGELEFGWVLDGRAIQ